MASTLTNLLLLALVAGSVLLWYRRKVGAALVYAVTILLVLIAVFPIPQLLLWPLEHRFPRFDQTERADVSGIVLLGGAAISASRTELMGHPVPGNAAHRVQAFLSLAQDHPEARLLVTGGGDNSRPAFREASLIRSYLIERGVDPERIAVEAVSRNTFENATFSRDIARPEPNQTWLLVTTARHTPRAVASFRSAGWNVTAVPTGPLLSELTWSITDVDLRGAVEIIGLALHEYLGLLAYRMQGRTGTMWP